MAAQSAPARQDRNVTYTCQGTGGRAGGGRKEGTERQVRTGDTFGVDRGWQAAGQGVAGKFQFLQPDEPAQTRWDGAGQLIAGQAQDL